MEVRTKDRGGDRGEEMEEWKGGRTEGGEGEQGGMQGVRVGFAVEALCTVLTHRDQPPPHHRMETEGEGGVTKQRCTEESLL